VDTATIEQRIDEAFEGDVRDQFGLRYLEMLQANWADLVKTLRRTVLLIALLIVSFFLFDHARTGELAIGPFKTENLAALLTLIPAAVSYLFFEFIDLMRVGSYYECVARGLVKSLFPSVSTSRLDLLLWPVTSFAVGLGAGFGLFRAENRKIGRVNERTNLLAAALLVVGILAFLPYSFARLYGSGHTNAIAVSASLAFTAFNVARGYLVIFDDEAEGRENDEKKARSRRTHG
jgi:hypothetical protein